MIDIEQADTPHDGDIKGTTASFFWQLFLPYMDWKDAHIEIRCLPLTATGKPTQRWFPVTHFTDAADYALSQAETTSVYMGVLPRVKGGGTAQHIHECGWLWCDIDGGTGTPNQAAKLLLDAMHQKALPAPHLIVVSGGGIHCYWRLDAPVSCTAKPEQERVRTVLKRLVLAIGGTSPGPHADVASTDPARILRVPGSWNHKQDIPRYVYLRCLRPDFETHSLTWWEGMLPPEPHPVVTRRATSHTSTQRTEGTDIQLLPATVQKLLHGASDGSKHFTMMDVAVAARKQGFGVTEITNFAEQVGWVSGVDMNAPQQIRHLEGIVDWTMRNIVPDPGG